MLFETNPLRSALYYKHRAQAYHQLNDLASFLLGGSYFINT